MRPDCAQKVRVLVIQACGRPGGRGDRGIRERNAIEDENEDEGRGGKEVFAPAFIPSVEVLERPLMDLPIFCQPGGALSESNNQARAKRQSRRTVRSVTPSTWAACSMDNPAKKRNLTNSAARASSRARSSNAASTLSRSSSLAFSGKSISSKATRLSPPP